MIIVSSINITMFAIYTNGYRMDLYPPVDLFTEELVKETKWYTLGMFLGVPTHELDVIISTIQAP